MSVESQAGVKLDVPELVKVDRAGAIRVKHSMYMVRWQGETWSLQASLPDHHAHGMRVKW
jgi:hypothetical protein